MILVLIVEIWFIGWLIACGMHKEACEIAKAEEKFSHYFVLMITWPHYIGYCMSKL